MSFERGWISLHQMLAARPDGDAAGGALLRGAQSAYPFNRGYMYPPPATHDLQVQVRPPAT